MKNVCQEGKKYIFFKMKEIKIQIFWLGDLIYFSAFLANQILDFKNWNKEIALDNTRVLYGIIHRWCFMPSNSWFSNTQIGSSTDLLI